MRSDTLELVEAVRLNCLNGNWTDAARAVREVPAVGLLVARELHEREAERLAAVVDSLEEGE